MSGDVPERAYKLAKLAFAMGSSALGICLALHAPAVF